MRSRPRSPMTRLTRPSTAPAGYPAISPRKLPGGEPVGDGADDHVGAGAQDGGQQQAPLVLQDPVTPPAWLDLGDEHGDLQAALLCLPDVVDDRVHERAVRAIQGLQRYPRVPAVPVSAEGRALGGVGVDANGDDVIAQGQRRVQGVLGELADVADGYDHQAFGRPWPVRDASQLELEPHRLV